MEGPGQGPLIAEALSRLTCSPNNSSGAVLDELAASLRKGALKTSVKAVPMGSLTVSDKLSHREQQKVRRVGL